MLKVTCYVDNELVAYQRCTTRREAQRFINKVCRWNHNGRGGGFVYGIETEGGLLLRTGFKHTVQGKIVYTRQGLRSNIKLGVC